MTDKAIDAAARAAYVAHHENGPTEEAYREPNMGRGGFKTEVCVWNAVAQAAISAYLTQREADGGWQPIDSAPRDGSHILVTDGKMQAVVTWEDYAVELWDCGWRDAGDMGWGGMIGQHPTHWMPLPARPQVKP